MSERRARWCCARSDDRGGLRLVSRAFGGRRPIRSGRRGVPLHMRALQERDCPEDEDERRRDRKLRAGEEGDDSAALRTARGLRPIRERVRFVFGRPSGDDAVALTGRCSACGRGRIGRRLGGREDAGLEAIRRRRLEGRGDERARPGQPREACRARLTFGRVLIHGA